jgi:predicted tellurium resistance membrane protein TerC
MAERKLAKVRSAAHGSRERPLITDAQEGASADLKQRQIRYVITMGFRVACFISMLWVPSPWRWFLLGAAVVLPYIAVIFANQADQRTHTGKFERGGRELENDHRKELP